MIRRGCGLTVKESNDAVNLVVEPTSGQRINTVRSTDNLVVTMSDDDDAEALSKGIKRCGESGCRTKIGTEDKYCPEHR